MIRILKSPFPSDMDSDEPPPWEYEEPNFINWVEEVFCESKRPDLELDEALDIVYSSGYTFEII